MWNIKTNKITFNCILKCKNVITSDPGQKNKRREKTLTYSIRHDNLIPWDPLPHHITFIFPHIVYIEVCSKHCFTRGTEFTPSFSGVRVARCLVSYVVFCRSLFVLFLLVIVLPLSFNLRILITLLVSSNS